MNVQTKIVMDFKMLGESYAEHLVTEYNKGESIIPWGDSHLMEMSRSNSENPENLDTGASGIILLLLELYHLSGNPVYLQTADQAIKKLIAYCDATPSSDYGFYTGRSGVVYLLIQRYKIDQDAELINSSLRLIKSANNAFLHSKFSNDYLYDGKSGALLVILELYLISKEKFLLEYIKQFADKILSEAQLSPQGVFWKNENEKHLEVSYGFGIGLAGIIFTLTKLNVYCNNPAINYVLTEANRFMDFLLADKLDVQSGCESHLAGEELVTGKGRSGLNSFKKEFLIHNQSWSVGMSGLLISLGGAHFPDASGEIIRALMSEKLLSFRIYDGLPGVALSMLHAGLLQSNEIIDDLLAMVYQNAEQSISELDLNGGLLQGQLGAMYFLLKMTGAPALSYNTIIAPFAEREDRREASEIDFNLSLPDTRKHLLSRAYEKTIFILDHFSPSALQQYLTQPSGRVAGGEIDLFNNFMKRLLDSEPRNHNIKYLADLFFFEQQKFDFFFDKSKNHFKIYQDQTLHTDNVIALLNEPDEWLFKQRISVSKKVKTIFTKWDWALLKNAKGTLQAQLDFMNKPEGAFIFILRDACVFEDVEIQLLVAYRILLDTFSRPKVMEQAILELKTYVQSLPDAAFRGLLLQLEVANISAKNEFIELFNVAVLSTIKKWVYMGILQVEPAPYFGN